MFPGLNGLTGSGLKFSDYHFNMEKLEISPMINKSISCFDAVGNHHDFNGNHFYNQP